MPHPVEVRLVLLVLLQPRALSDILVTSNVPGMPDANADVFNLISIDLFEAKPAADTFGQALFDT